MKLLKILLLEIILISILLTSLNARISKMAINTMENGQQDFINNYLKENQKKQEAINKSRSTIEVGYRNTTKTKSRYIRGQRLRDINKELEKLRIENERLSIERERLELENDILSSKSKSSKSKKRTVKRKTHRVKRYKKSKRKYGKYKKKKYRSRKIFIKVYTRSRRMKIYRGNRLLYSWKISFKETLKKPKKYKRRRYKNQYIYKYNKKNKIYFKNGQASKNFKIYNTRTLYSKIRLRRKYVNRLNKLIKQYGRRNVIIKIIR
ncbi:hypothetical protein MNB_SV-9-307 [hydrothermal vent metagenome]|uniref:Uncharacterized protein n=1 Tax=hydrothermal vent metagenome TaxID=652676 RepID=A0A1W1BB05_9ZZZZ